MMKIIHYLYRDQLLLSQQRMKLGYCYPSAIGYWIYHLFQFRRASMSSRFLVAIAQSIDELLISISHILLDLIIALQLKIHLDHTN